MEACLAVGDGQTASAARPAAAGFRDPEVPGPVGPGIQQVAYTVDDVEAVAATLRTAACGCCTRPRGAAQPARVDLMGPQDPSASSSSSSSRRRDVAYTSCTGRRSCSEDEQYELLKKESVRTGKSIGELVRTAVDDKYGDLSDEEYRQRLADGVAGAPGRLTPTTSTACPARSTWRRSGGSGPSGSTASGPRGRRTHEPGHPGHDDPGRPPRVHRGDRGDRRSSLTSPATVRFGDEDGILRGVRSGERRAARELLALIAWIPVDEAIAELAGEYGRIYRSYWHRRGGLPHRGDGDAGGQSCGPRNVKHFPMFQALEAPY